MASGRKEKKEVTEEDKKRFAEAMKKKEEEEKDKKPEEKKDEVTKKGELSSESPFNKGEPSLGRRASAARRTDGERQGRGHVRACASRWPGRVTRVNITGGEFPGTPVGSRIAGVFRRARPGLGPGHRQQRIIAP
ncbi:MAG: hypothetical protein U0263_28975 [Polyangiaceae bacterium]